MRLTRTNGVKETLETVLIQAVEGRLRMNEGVFVRDDDGCISLRTLASEGAELTEEISRYKNIVAAFAKVNAQRLLIHKFNI